MSDNTKTITAATPAEPVAASAQAQSAAPAAVAAHCANPACTSSSPATSRCARCHSVWYCWRACQQADWKEGHQPRCLPPSLLRVAAIQQMLDDKVELGYLTALRALSRMHSPSVSASLPPGELSEATDLERPLRQVFRARLRPPQGLQQQRVPRRR